MLWRDLMNGGRELTVDPRLKPEMASFRLKVLGFVRAYLAEHGGSPSYGEIAAALQSNRQRVKKSVHRLVNAGQLTRRPGHRGLGLPDQAGGWAGPDAGAGVTNRPLPVPVDLDYIPPDEPQQDRE